MTIHNWGIEYCKSYADQLRDKTHMHRAVHAAECIEYLLSLVQKEWVGLTAAERIDIVNNAIGLMDAISDAEVKLKEKNCAPDK